MVPVEAKADGEPTWVVKIYGTSTSTSNATEIYYTFSETDPGIQITEDSTVVLPGNSWIYFDTTKAFGVNETAALSHNIGEYTTTPSIFYNKYDCPVRVEYTHSGSSFIVVRIYPIESSLDTSSDNASSHVHSWTHCTIYEPTEKSDGLEGECCSCGAQRNTSVIPFIIAVLENRYRQIDLAYPGRDTILEMKNNCNFSQAFMKKLASRSDCSFILRFTYKHINYEAYIPAGTTFDTSLEWYGPEKIMQMFEWKQLN